MLALCQTHRSLLVTIFNVAVISGLYIVFRVAECVVLGRVGCSFRGAYQRLGGSVFV